MNPIHRAWHAVVHDEVALWRWTRGFLLWLVTIASQVASSPDAAAWSRRDWCVRLLIAALAGSAGLIALGEKNPTPPQVQP